MVNYRCMAAILRIESALLLLATLGGCGTFNSPAPSLVGMTQNDAERLLQRRGLPYGVSFDAVDSGQPLGIVTSQTPAESELLSSKAPYVQFQVAVGNESVIVPDLRGRSSAEADEILEPLALTPRITDLEWIGPEAAGKVVSSMPVPGASAQQGMLIDLRVGSSFAPFEKTLVTDLPPTTVVQDVELTADSRLLVLYSHGKEWESTKLFLHAYAQDGALLSARELEVGGKLCFARVFADERVLAMVKCGINGVAVPKQPCRFVCFSVNGGILWDNLHGEGDFIYQPREVLALANGDLLVVGQALRTGMLQRELPRPYLVRTRGDGTLIWERELHDTGLGAVTCAVEKASGRIELFGTKEAGILWHCLEPGVACATVTETGEVESHCSLIEERSDSPFRHIVNGVVELPDGSAVVLISRYLFVETSEATTAYFLTNIMVHSGGAPGSESPVTVPGCCSILHRDRNGDILVAGKSFAKMMATFSDIGRPYLASYAGPSQMNWERVVPRTGEYVDGRVVGLIPNAYEDGHLAVVLRGGNLVWLRTSSEGFAPEE